MIRKDIEEMEKEKEIVEQRIERMHRKVEGMPNMEVERFSLHIYTYSCNLCLGVCLFVCLIITLESLNQFALNFDWRTLENHRNVLSSVLRFYDECVDFNSKNSFSR